MGERQLSEYEDPYNVFLDLISGGQESVFWNQTSHQFWALMPKLPDADQIIQLCQNYSKEIIFLTSPSSKKQAHFAASGKIEWLNQHYPQIKFFIGKHKEELAHRDALLIDDSEGNITRWQAAGGAGILLPRPWNSERYLETIPTLRTRLDGAFPKRK
jgi:hypothetical protein